MDFSKNWLQKISRVRFLRHHEVAMNCQNCNTTIDYRFQTNCEHCETEQTSLSPGILIQAPIESVNHATWTRRIVNLLYILISSAAGMVSGAVVVYFGTAMMFMAFVSSTGDPSHDCSRGMFIGFLAITTGAFLGTIGGSILAVKNPLCKN
jgi:hypothetical protein